MRRVWLLPMATLFLVTAAFGAPVSWSGQVIDIRSKQPVVGARVYGGGQGRVDLTPAATTDGEGRFTAIYEGPLDLGFWIYYRLEVDYPPVGNRYFTHVSSHGSPTNFTVQLVPRDAHVRALVRNKVTGLPIADASVSLRRPGQVLQTVVTDNGGRVQFLTHAYETFGFTSNWTEGIPEANWLDGRSSFPEQPQAINDYALSASAPGYAAIQTSDLPVVIPTVSSVTDALHSSVVIDLAPLESGATGSATAELVSPSTEPVLTIHKAVRLDLELIAGNNYQIQSGPAADGPWENVGDPIPGQSSPYKAYVDADADQRYFRVVVLPALIQTDALRY